MWAPCLCYGRSQQTYWAGWGSLRKHLQCGSNLSSGRHNKGPLSEGLEQQTYSLTVLLKVPPCLVPGESSLFPACRQLLLSVASHGNERESELSDVLLQGC